LLNRRDRKISEAMMTSNIFEQIAETAGMSPEAVSELHQVLGSVPPQQLGGAVTQAVEQLPADEYAQHTDPGVGGTDPFGALGKGQLASLAGTILSALAAKGVSSAQVSQQTGTGPVTGGQISPEQMAAITQWVQQNHPEVLGQVAQQYQQQPDILHSLLGNKALMATAAILGAKYMSDHYKPGMGMRLEKKK
jgi:hypothetical protein